MVSLSKSQRQLEFRMLYLAVKITNGDQKAEKIWRKFGESSQEKSKSKLTMGIRKQLQKKDGTDKTPARGNSKTQNKQFTPNRGRGTGNRGGRGRGNYAGGQYIQRPNDTTSNSNVIIPPSKPDGIKCFGCGDIGHIQRECPKANKDK